VKTLFVLATLSFISTLSFAEEIKENEVFRDSKADRYVRVCKVEGETYYVAESCGKHWEKAPRKRSEIAKQVKEYKDLKANDKVMIYIMRNGNPKWVLGTVSYMYEDGTISVMEYYSHHGFNSGTLNWQVPYSNISHVESTPSEGSGFMCAKEDIEVVVGHYNEKKYKIEKGEKVEVKEVFKNGIASVKLDGVLVNLVRYGHNNKLPVAKDKLEVCPATVEVHDGPRSLKPVQDDGAGSPSSAGSKAKDK
jgi:hypothetical protein